MAFAENILTLARLKGTYGHEQRPAAGIADIVGREAFLRIVRQTVNQLFNAEVRPHRVHGGSGMGAYGAHMHIGASVLGILCAMNG